MDAPQDSRPKRAPTAAELAEQLEDLLSREYDEALLPPFDGHLPFERRAPCRYSSVLRWPLVRDKILSKWSWLWSSGSMRDRDTVKREVATLSREVTEKLRLYRAGSAAQAAHLKPHLCRILKEKNPDAALAPLVWNDRGTIAPDSCLYPDLLRAGPNRSLILEACHARTTTNPRSVNQEANRLLVDILRRSGSLADHESLPRHTSRAMGPVKRLECARKLLLAKRIAVEALCDTFGVGREQPKGARFDVDALHFLEAAHDHACTGTAAYKPIDEPTGQKYAAIRAVACWRILDLLGREMRSRPYQRATSWVPLTEVVQHITGRRSDGQRYTQIDRLAIALDELGLIRYRESPRKALALAHKGMKSVRRSSVGE